MHLRTLALSTVLLLVSAASAMAADAPVLGFDKPVFVDSELAGGEPIVFADVVHGTLIYSAHEGTTHLYRPGLASTAPASFLANYRNQVNIWTSTDNGTTWKRSINNLSNGADPSKSQGFSDPDLTQDEGGRVYDTGINLANDSLFSSVDGGRTFDKGTAQCHDGDRPWLAGGKAEEAWMATDANEDPSAAVVAHTVYHTTDGGSTCSQSGVVDYGSTPDGGSFFGFGKLYFDHQRRMLVEPVIFNDKDGKAAAIGVGTAKPNDANDYKFTDHKAAPTPNGITAHFPGVALDSTGTLYLVWDTNERLKGTTGGCGDVPGQTGGETPAPNYVYMASSKDFGETWSAPVVVAHPDNARVFWPWITAGAAGRVAIAFYQTNKVADIDCQTSDISVKAASIAGADTAAPQITVTDPVGRPVVRASTVCQGGTTCVATGQDRRLGDYLTVALDPNGCELIATGDVTQNDPATGQPRQTALPLFVRQNDGQSLTGRNCGAPPPAAVPAATTGSCSDRIPPRSQFVKGTKATRRGMLLHGSASDQGCRNAAANFSVRGRVARMYVSVARAVGRRCRYLSSSGRFSAARSCLRTSYLRAHGTTKWSLTIKHALPSGRYKLWSRGVDARDNIERKRASRNFRRLVVR